MHAGSLRTIQIHTMVFDFDGTLAELHLDFSEMKRRLARLAEAYLGYRPEPGKLPALEWLSVMQQELDRKDGLTGAELFRAGHALIFDMEMEAARRGRLFPYVKDMMSRLRHTGIRLGIITRNCQQAVTAVFPDWARHCDCLLSREQVSGVKPDPSHLLQALDLLNSAPHQAVMVGDHPMDIETGQRAGTWTGAVASGNLSEAELAEAGPDWLASDCQELVRYLAERKILGNGAQRPAGPTDRSEIATPFRNRPRESS